MALDFLEDIDFADRKTQLIAAGVAVGAGVLFTRLKGSNGGGGATPATANLVPVASQGFGTRSDAMQGGVFGWTGNFPSGQVQPNPPNTTPDPHAGKVKIYRGGLAGYITAAPQGSVQCPAGYVAAKGQDGTIRCTLQNDADKAEHGQRTSFIPALGQTAFTDGTGPAILSDQGGGIPGIIEALNADVNPDGWGTVGGATIMPAPISGGSRVRVRPGQTLADIARSAYGDARHWRWIVKLNPEMNQPTAGDELRVM